MSFRHFRLSIDLTMCHASEGGDEQIFGYVQSKHLVFSVEFFYFRQILQCQCYFVAKFTYITKRSNVETINIKYAVGVFCQ